MKKLLGLMSRWIASGICAGGLVLTVPAMATSVTALSFVQRGASTNAFLLESSRLAEANGASLKVVALARRESADRPRVVAAFANWAARARQAEREADFGPSLDTLGRIFGPTDRSVTIIVHAGRPVLPDLAVLHGRDFDGLYAVSQTDALSRLIAFYVDFIKNGDDETLRALAVRDLPRARQLLVDARRL